MCLIIKKIPAKLRRRKTGYKVYRPINSWAIDEGNDNLRGEYNYLTYRIGETYKAKTLDWDTEIDGMASSLEYNKGIHVYLDYPREFLFRAAVVVEVSFTKPILYGVSRWNDKEQEVALVNEITLLKEVTR